MFSDICTVLRNLCTFFVYHTYVRVDVVPHRSVLSSVANCASHLNCQGTEHGVYVYKRRGVPIGFHVPSNESRIAATKWRIDLRINRFRLCFCNSTVFVSKLALHSSHVSQNVDWDMKCCVFWMTTPTKSFDQTGLTQGFVGRD